LHPYLKGDTMKKKGFLLVAVGMLLLLTAQPGQSQSHIWTDKGCDSTYNVGEQLIIYFVPSEDAEFELWAYDALMDKELLASGVGTGDTYYLEKTVTYPPGPLTFVLKVPCGGECDSCMCDYGQCTIFVQEHECECPHVCRGNDLWSQKCVNGECVDDQLVEADSEECMDSDHDEKGVNSGSPDTSTMKWYVVVISGIVAGFLILWKKKH
jgi:hypothetical protein